MFHVLNRAVGREAIFLTRGDYDAFVEVLAEVKQRIPIRLLSYCVMPNHWHMLLWPRSDGQLSEFMRLVTVTHTQRWHAAHATSGTGPLYQGRFKSFPVMNGEYFHVVSRYVERNAVRAKLVTNAEDWQWSSAWHRSRASSSNGLLDPGPEELPQGWIELLNTPQFRSELAAVRESVKGGSPFGSEPWRKEAASKLGLESTLRKPGRPRSILKPDRATTPDPFT